MLAESKVYVSFSHLASQLCDKLAESGVYVGFGLGQDQLACISSCTVPHSRLHVSSAMTLSMAASCLLTSSFWASERTSWLHVQWCHPGCSGQLPGHDTI